MNGKLLEPALVCEDVIENTTQGYKVKEDVVHNPSHYTSHPSGIECIDIVKHMNFPLGSAMKYIWRAGLKDDKVLDLRKAKEYIDIELKRLEGLDSKRNM